jgi:hypothetical protein
MTALPQTPAALLEELFAVFPKYRSDYHKYGPLHNEPPTFHSILIEFTVFFATELASFSEAQLRKFGAFVSEAVEHGGELKNAFGTCLLEHLHQIRAKDRFSPYLSQFARERTRA